MVSVRNAVFLSTLAIAPVCLTFAQESSPLAKHVFDTPPQPAPPRAESALSSEQKGDLFMARKMFRDAIDAYREGPQNSPVTWNKIGIAYHQLGELGAAKRNYEKAMRLDKKYAEAVNNDGTVYYAQKKYGAAISRYKKAIALNPEAASFWSNLGTAYYSRGRFQDMTVSYQKALELDPGIFEHRGMVGSELQDRTVADRARYHFEMARIYAKTGRDDLALQYLRRSLEEGLKDRTKMTLAPEFAKLRETVEFKELLTLEPRVL